MKIHSKRFQTELEFADDMVISIPNGLPGLPQSKRFCILELGDPNSPFKWLHDVDDTGIALLITDPYQFFPTYNPKISPKCLEEVGVSDDKVEEDVMIFTIVKVSKGGTEAFTNLRAPVVVNSKSKTAKQIILEDDEYSVKTALFREADGKQEVATGLIGSLSS